MKATIENSHETEGQPTTPYLDYLEKIFDKKFITVNQSKFYTKDGKIDFKKLEQVLVKEGYSEGFARRLVNDLKNEKIKDEDLPKYKRTAEFNLNRERLEEIYGKHGAKVARAVLDFFENNGDIKSEYSIRLFSMAGTLESWKKLSELVQIDLSNYALGEISERELKKQLSKAKEKMTNEEEHETLELVLSKDKLIKKDSEETGGRNYEAIAAAKNMQELKKVAIESGLYNEVTWNNLVNEIANMIMKHAEMLPYEQQQQQFITQIVSYYYQQTIYEEIEKKKEKSEKKNRSDGEVEEERKMREFAKTYVDVLKTDGKADIETLIINNLRENEKRLNNIAENFMGMMDGNGKMKEEERRVLETLAGKRPPVDFATLSPETKAKLLKAIRTGLVGYA